MGRLNLFTPSNKSTTTLVKSNFRMNHHQVIDPRGQADSVCIPNLERNQGKGNNPQDRFSPVETSTIGDAAAPPKKFAADWALE